jgi:hypothetical protein
VSYYLDSDSNRAYWASYYTTTDDWNKQFFKNARHEPLSELYPHAFLNYLKSDAEPMQVAPPMAEIITDSVSGSERLLKLRLTSQRGAAHLELVLEPENPADFTSIKLAGELLQLEPQDTQKGKVYYTMLHGLPAEKNTELEVRLKAGTLLTLYLYDQSLGLPNQLVKEPKPSHVIAEQGRSSNLTVVRKRYTF